MLSEFLVYLRLGLEHILDLRGYDHILFIVALTAPYTFRAWRAVLIQVTAFTVGHSLTLVLATLDRVRVSTDWVEFLIPVTIVATALVQLGRVRRERGGAGARGDPSVPTGGVGATWLLALGFGLVHGLGFSNFLRALLGAEDSLLLPLFAFNVGIEVGQVAVVVVMLVASAAASRFGGLTPTRRVGIISTATALVAAYLAMGRLPL